MGRSVLLKKNIILNIYSYFNYNFKIIFLFRTIYNMCIQKTTNFNEKIYE